MCEDDDSGESGRGDFRGEAAANSGEACHKRFLGGARAAGDGEYKATNGAQRCGRRHTQQRPSRQNELCGCVRESGSDIREKGKILNYP